MAKKKNYGFKTPVRRGVKNITGNKVEGNLTGGECKIVKTFAIQVNEKYIYQKQIKKTEMQKMFGEKTGIAAIGGYFKSTDEVVIKLKIEEGDDTEQTQYILEGNRWYAIGLDKKCRVNDGVDIINFEIIIDADTDSTIVEYTNIVCGFVDKNEFKDSKDANKHYNNSKKTICYPEQFYLNEIEKELGGDDYSVIIKKSCNRCQRYLPINPDNQRIQLAFSNHCTSKAPCTHKLFSKYKIIENDIREDYDKITEIDKGYQITEDYVQAYYGHQLECKACKKFFVNAALNKLRSTSQQREDSLRRRAIERLIGLLLDKEWIYHQYKKENQIEFDVAIWKKFKGKCFKCNIKLETTKDMHLDHTMPLSQLYPLDETATCLCSKCNSEKSDIYPVDYYTSEQLTRLAEITQIPINIIKSRKANQIVVKKLRGKIIWFVDEFLTFEEYTKERDGKKAADSILHSVNKAINTTDIAYNIIEEYERVSRG
jgi:hypothetical protein